MTIEQQLEYFDMKQVELQNKALGETENFYRLKDLMKKYNDFIEENAVERHNLVKTRYYRNAFETYEGGSFDYHFLRYNRYDKPNDLLRLDYNYDFEGLLKDIEELGFQEDFDKLMKKILEETNEIDFVSFCKQRSIAWQRYLEKYIGDKNEKNKTK